MFRRAVDAQHAVDQDADPIGDPFDVGQDMGAEQDRPPLALNEMDHRHQEIAAGDGVEAERGVIEDEQVGIGGDRQGQGDVTRWPLDSRRSFARAGSRSGRESGRASADSSGRYGTSG